MREDGHGEVKVDLDDHGGGHAIEMKEFDLLRDAFLDQPAACIFAHDLLAGEFEVIRDIVATVTT